MFGASASAPPPPPPPTPPASGSANLWVDGNGGTCARQATAGAYVDTASCGTFDAAWDAAQSGDLIVVRAGSYGAQNVSGSKSAATTIRGEAGVTLQGASTSVCGYSDGLMCANANFMVLENMTIDAGSNHGASSGAEINGQNVTFRNVNLYGPFVSLYVNNGQSFTWQGGRLGRDGTVGGLRSCSNADGQPIQIEADGATLDGIRINPQDADPTVRPCAPSNGFHLEDIRLQAASNVTISNTTFVDSSGVPGNGDGSGNIFVTAASASTTAASNLRLVSNVFERVKGSYAIQVHANVQRYNNWVIQGNRFDQPVLMPGTYVNLSTCGNTGEAAASWLVSC